MSEDLPNEAGDTNDVRTLRGKLKEREGELEAARAQAAKADALERELAFARAGVDLANPNSKYFTKGYDGDLTADAIKSEWGSFSGGAATAPPPDHSADIAAAQRITDAGTGAQSPDSQDEAARYRAELETLRNSSNRDPYVLQRQAEEIMAKYGSRVVGQ